MIILSAMMNLLTTLKTIADELDRLGLHMQADRVDATIIKYAQEMPPPPPAEDSSASPQNTKTQHKIAHTLLMKFKKLKDLYASYLPQLDYLGTDNISAVLTAFDQFLLVFEAVLRNKPGEIDNNDLQTFNGTLKRKETELKRSLSFRPTPLKLKVDKGNLYDPLAVLCESLKRQYDSGFKDLNPVVRRARSLQTAFSNVLQTASEQIAHSNLLDLG